MVRKFGYLHAGIDISETDTREPFRYYTPGDHFDSGQCRSGLEYLQRYTYTRCVDSIFDFTGQY